MNIRSHWDLIFRKYKFIVSYQKHKPTSETEIPQAKNCLLNLKNHFHNSHKKIKSETYNNIKNRNITSKKSSIKLKKSLLKHFLQKRLNQKLKFHKQRIIYQA